jgi:hypothetical protein
MQHAETVLYSRHTVRSSTRMSKITQHKLSLMRRLPYFYHRNSYLREGGLAANNQVTDETCDADCEALHGGEEGRGDLLLILAVLILRVLVLEHGAVDGVYVVSVLERRTCEQAGKAVDVATEYGKRD